MLILLIACDSPAPAPEDPVVVPDTPAEPPPPPPPDPCRHSVLEQLSPAGLSEMTGDADCLARVARWQESSRLWAASADMDGDGAAEVLVVLSPQADGQPATLIIGDGEAPLTLHWPDDATFGEKVFRLIDIAQSEDHQELLIQQRAADSEDPAWLSHIFTYTDGILRETELTGSSGTLTIEGDGRVGVDTSDCAFQRVSWYSLDNGELGAAGEEGQVKEGAAAFQQEDGSFQCPG